MSKSVLVLGVSHELQGSKFTGHVDDPCYTKLIRSALAGKDFLFEEAAGLGETIAEKIVGSLLGEGRYLDIDPSPLERAGLKIDSNLPSNGMIDPFDCPPYMPMRFESLRQRESVWLLRIQKQDFRNAVVIVGIAHSISVANRLEEAGITVEEIRGYTPYEKLCRLHQRRT